MHPDNKVRNLCNQLIEAEDPADIERISRELQDTLRAQMQDVRRRIHEVAPLLPAKSAVKKLS